MVGVWVHVGVDVQLGLRDRVEIGLQVGLGVGVEVSDGVSVVVEVKEQVLMAVTVVVWVGLRVTVRVQSKCCSWQRKPWREVHGVRDEYLANGRAPNTSLTKRPLINWWLG